MPSYDFYCKDCQKVYDIYVPLKILDNPVKCPHCEKDMTKMLSTPYFVVR